MKLREIERLRGLAVLMVVFTHWNFANRLLPKIPHNLWSGVDLFFVISGYVVTLSLQRLLPSFDGVASFTDAFHRAQWGLKTFYARRFFRILPPVVACVIAHRLLIIGFAEFGSPEGWIAELITFLGGLYNYVKPVNGQDEFGIYWSLSVEEHFYLILPILFVVLRTNDRRLAACAGVSLMTIYFRTISHPVIEMNDLRYYEIMSSHLRFDSLMAGVALALVSGGPTTHAILPKWFMRFLLLPTAMLLLGCLPGAAPNYVMQREGFVALWALAGLLVGFAGLDRGYVLAFPLIGRFFEYLGGRSYVLYLVHYDMMRVDFALRRTNPAYARFVPDLNTDSAAAWRTAVVFSGALVVSEIVRHTVEQPFIRLGRHLTRARSGSSGHTA
jgi:peptidoglycan/LPS O-acetylase OafA/YrhL